MSGCTDKDRLAALEKENKELHKKLDALPQNATIELQGKCSSQARLLFNQSYRALPLATFTNHYSVKANKCFISIQSIDFKHPGTPNGSVTAVTAIVDAFEGKEIATQIWSGPKLGAPNITPTRCDVLALDGSALKCHSVEEFKTLTKTYIGD
jgi:hypothetical protein